MGDNEKIFKEVVKMTNTTKEFNLNQRNMISLAFMLGDEEIKDILETYLCWVLYKSKLDTYTKEYVRNVFDRLVTEAKPLLECISRDEVLEGTKRLWDVNEKLTSVNLIIREEVIENLDKHGLEEMENLNNTLNNKIEEFNKEIESVIGFYESL